MSFEHLPVLANETIESLNIKPDGIYIDGTAGGGGHSQLILSRLTTGRLIAIDQDPDAINATSARLMPYGCVNVVKANFADMQQVAQSYGINKVDGILLDIGVSSHQLDTPERGFSFHNEAPLDMRMSQDGTTAAQLVNTLSVSELARIISVYGEERYAGKIARAIEQYRLQCPIETTSQLSEIIKSAIPAPARREGGHPARRTFQALRIAVNGELDRLSEGINAAFGLLNPGGRLSIITFHSLEDRIVKQSFAEFCKGCTCPPDFPICVCGNKPKGKLINRKPIIANQDELDNNPRSRSAKLRTIEKL